MATTTTTGPAAATEEDLRRMPDDGHRYELVDGRILTMSPAGSRHGNVCVRLVARLAAYVEQTRLGHVFDSSTGFRMPGGNVRAPDVAFVARGRFPDEQLPEGFPDLAPDLAVEILSPGDSARYVLDKVGEYLQASVRLVWVIDPKRGAATIHRSLTNVKTIEADGSLDGEDVLPGFRCRLADVIG